MCRHCLYGLSIVFISLFSVKKVVGQLSISGIVTDSVTEEAIDAAGISLQGPVNTGTHTNHNGHFEIVRIPPGDYVLKVSYLGYKTVEKNIHLQQDLLNFHILLEETGLFIQPIEIKGTRASKDAPFTKTNISAEEIEKENQVQDLPYLLNRQPSVMVTSDAGAGVGYTNIWIRGSDATRTNVTFNGIPVNDAESSGTFFVNFPDIASSANSIQVQRGVGTSTNGAGAFGATINLSTNTFHEDAYGQLSTDYGSFNTQKYSVKAGSGLLSNHFTVDARLSTIQSDGYIDRASSDLKSFYFSTAYFNKKTALRFNVFSGKETTYQAWNGVPEDSIKAGNRTYNGLGLMPNGKYYNDQTDNYTQTYYQLFWNQEINPNWNFNIAAFLTRGKGYYEEYKAQQSYSAYGLDNPIFGKDTLRQTNLIRDRWLDNYFYGTIFSVNYQNKNFNSTLGGGWNDYDGKHYGKVIWAEYAIDKGYEYYYTTAYKKDFNIYWKSNKQILPGLTAFLDLQYRHVLYDINGFKNNPDIIQNNSYDFFNPKAGLNYQFHPNDRLYVSYAIAHKEPNRNDFEANIEETPTAEKLYDLEIGYEKKGTFYQVHTNLYYMYYKDQLVLTGKINESGAYTRSNVPKSYRLGLEINGHIHFAHIFSLSANAAFTQNKIKDYTAYLDNWDNGKQRAIDYKNTTISFSPAVIGGATLSAELFKDFTAGLSGKYVGRRYLDNTASLNRSMDPYLVNDLQLHYQWHPKGVKKINFSFLINNLFNIKYLTNGFTYAYLENDKIRTDNSYFPQAGINFTLGVKIDL